MKLYMETVSNSSLFSHLDRNEIQQILTCLHARTKEYESGSFLIREEDVVDDIGIILDGKLKIITEDIMGNRSITAILGPKQVFGQIVASKTTKNSPVSIQADTDVTVLLLAYKKLVTPCTHACTFHAQIIQNMMNILSERNFMMNRKVNILSQRSIREKLISFLAWYSQDHEGITKFTIPFNRDELADYLCVNRSALSREISKMIDERIINTQKNYFELLKLPLILP